MLELKDKFLSVVYVPPLHLYQKLVKKFIKKAVVYMAQLFIEVQCFFDIYFLIIN